MAIDVMNRPVAFGFGGLLILIAASGAVALEAFHRITHNAAVAEARLHARSEALHQIREAIYLSGAYAGDYLLNPDAASAAGLRQSLVQLESQTDTALRTCLDDADPEAARSLKSLRAEIVNYWSVLGLMLDVAQRERRRGVDQYFYKQLEQRRPAMLSIAGQVAAIENAQRQAGRLQTIESGSKFRRNAILTLAVILLLGAALVVISARRLLFLERGVRERSRDLEALSARLVEVQEQERKSLARELHDEIGQSLSALSIEASNGLHAGDPHPHLESIRTRAESCVAAVRDLALSLRPSMLDDFGLIPALEWLAREMSRKGITRVRVDDGGEPLPVLDDDVKTCIFRVAQEALRNCERHARAANVTLILHRRSGELELQIVDDGVGFDAQRTRGLGLLGISERVEGIGGRVEIYSQQGRGTQILVRTPIAVEVRAA